MKKLFLLALLFFACFYSYSQNKLTGKVYDENGKPMSGVFIFEKGSMSSTTSTNEGSYSINYKDTASVIIFSYTGYLKNQIMVERRTTYDASMIPANNVLGTAEIVGTRKIGRTQTETAVGVDIIDVSKLANSSGQIEVNQLLQYAAPSFNSNKQSGADGADHIDPATLRGLGPDQTLVLINGKRRHQSSLINIFGTRGRGNTGTDLNAIPVSAIDRIEILRDGASAQYGSDAIAGVINVVLKSNTGEFNGNVSYGMNLVQPPSNSKALKTDTMFDGQAWQFSANQGVKIGKDGFANFNLEYGTKERTNRPADPSKVDIYRKKYGDAASENGSFYMNTQFAAGEKTDVYAFGGYNYRFTDAYAWTREADDSRNVIPLYPMGFDPKIQSVIQDKSMSLGLRSKLENNWNMDINNTLGANNFHFIVNNTLNASLLDKSPTRFDAGGFSLTENTSSVNFSKLYSEVLSGLNIAFGSEFRINNYKIVAGEEGSWKNYGPVIFSIDSAFDDKDVFTGMDTTFRPGGAQGFPGFQPSNEVNESRTNLAAYLDAELDVTNDFMIGVAARAEKYSDFGSTVNGKLAARYKIGNYVSLRGSYSTGFRAPSLAQQYYNTTFTDFVGGKSIDKIIAANNSPITRALGIPPLKEEKSNNISYGFAIQYKSLALTVDAYSVNIKDRIVLTGAFGSDDPTIGYDLQKLNVGAAQFFTNAVNTTTNGVDVVFNYTPLITDKQSLRFSLAANFNNMKIDEIHIATKLKDKKNTYFGLREQYFLLSSAPKSKLTTGLEYTCGKFVANARLNMFGKVELMNWNDDGDEVATKEEIDVYNSKFTTDLSLSYTFSKVRITLGGNNILNVYPDAHDPSLTETGGIWDPVQMGFTGSYFYTKIGLKF